MIQEKEPTSVIIRKIVLDNVYFEGLGPLDVKAIAREVELKSFEIAKDKDIADTWKILALTALFYAAKVYSRNNISQTRDKQEERQLENAIEKLNNCLNRLPME